VSVRAWFTAGMRIAARHPFATGLAQTLAVWLLALAGFATVGALGGNEPSWHYSIAVLWVACGFGLTGSLVLYVWHRRRARDRTASGVKTGSLAWPTAIVLVTMTISVVAMSISPE
jgi:hypothetical protein